MHKFLIVPIVLHGCQTWTLLVDTKRCVQTLETKCFRKLLQVSYQEYKACNFVQSMVTTLLGCQKIIFTTVRWRKLVWFGHVTWYGTLKKPFSRDPRKESQLKQTEKDWMVNMKIGLVTPCRTCKLQARPPQMTRLVSCYI